MMEAEADSRGFFHAMKQAFVADGLQYNWTIQQKHFPTFTPILDFPHAIERIYEVARAALHGSGERVWEEYVKWITAVWQGRVADVLQDLRVNSRNVVNRRRTAKRKIPAKYSPKRSLTWRTTSREWIILATAARVCP